MSKRNREKKLHKIVIGWKWESWTNTMTIVYADGHTKRYSRKNEVFL